MFPLLPCVAALVVKPAVDPCMIALVEPPVAASVVKPAVDPVAATVSAPSVSVLISFSSGGLFQIYHKHIYLINGWLQKVNLEKC